MKHTTVYLIGIGVAAGLMGLAIYSIWRLYGAIRQTLHVRSLKPLTEADVRRATCETFGLCDRIAQHPETPESEPVTITPPPHHSGWRLIWRWLIYGADETLIEPEPPERPYDYEQDL